MKKKFLWLLLATAISTASAQITNFTTQNPPVTPKPTPVEDPLPRNDVDQPCKNIEEACKSGGYYAGGELQHQGLWEDCVGPLLNGKAITGLQVNSSDVQACKTRIKNMPKAPLIKQP